jgi:hypothetical protein
MIEKEFRALLPIWAICAAGLVATALHLPPPIHIGGAAVYILSCAALGSLAFGHEYSHGTMAALLSQPIARRRIYLAKLGVLALLLFGLRALLAVIRFPEARSPFGPLIVELPVLVALFLAPWLTLVTRSSLAGGMFSLSLASFVLVGAERLSTGGYGFTDEVDLLKIALIRWPMLALCAVGAALGWRAFARLEVIEGRGTPLPDYLPVRSAAGRRRPARPRPALWRLVGKELRLQQMTFLIAGLFVAFYIGVVGWREPGQGRISAVEVMTAINRMVVSLLAGSLASAEERHLGTIEWQLLLPISTLRQWMAKTGTALGVMLLLGVGLPIGLCWVLPPAAGPQPLRWLPNPAMAAMTGAVGVFVSLYISSLVSSGVRALLVTVPSLVAGVSVVRLLQDTVHVITPPEWTPFHRPLTVAARVDLLVGASALVLAGLLYLAMLNHRTTDRRGVGLTWQVAYVGICLAFIAVVSETLGF